MGDQNKHEVGHTAILSSVSTSQGLLQDGDIVERDADGRVLTAVFTSMPEPDGNFVSEFVAGARDLRSISTERGIYAMDDEFVEVDRNETLTFLGNPAYDAIVAAPRGSAYRRIEIRPMGDLPHGTPVIGADGWESTIGNNDSTVWGTVAMLIRG